MVIIKLDDHGMIVKIDEEAEFEQIRQELKEKLKQSVRFFKNAQIALTIQGKELSDEEELELVQLIEEVGQMEIVCLLGHDEIKDAEDLTAIDLVLENRKLRIETERLKEEMKQNERIAQNDAEAGRFYKGTLRSGQVLESEGSIIILGDVNPGGKVVSKRNIIVLGALKGYAYAGTEGKEDCFVAALEMRPAQIRLGDIIARSSDQREVKNAGPKIAFLQDGVIYIETITKNVLNGLPF